MTRIKKSTPTILVAVLVAGTIGYILGCTSSERELASQSLAAQQDQAKGNGGTQAEANRPKTPVKAVLDRETYYPGTEELASNEMRVTACGTGMPNARPKQAAACWLVELGNGDKFLFDIGTG